jgi:hypothetical protein
MCEKLAAVAADRDELLEVSLVARGARVQDPAKVVARRRSRVSDPLRLYGAAAYLNWP